MVNVNQLRESARTSIYVIGEHTSNQTCMAICRAISTVYPEAERQGLGVDSITISIGSGESTSEFPSTLPSTQYRYRDHMYKDDDDDESEREKPKKKERFKGKREKKKDRRFHHVR